ncbi:MAG TPA: PQQ-dependent sugar dehydrogenase [Solirubrobacterales bacterium]|nr:PQQ-dependent sugar dehydrogenase [Solirubrobacterales bacterium]
MGRRSAIALAALLAAVILGTAPAGAATKAKYKNKIGFDLVTKIASPTSLASPPGFKSLVFATTRQGKVRVIDGGRLLPRPALDISKRVNHRWFEQGLLGLAFSPDFAKTGRYYVHYTATNGDIKVVEYRVDPKKDPTVTLPASGRTLMRIPEMSERGNHNGGELAFLGKYLYIAIGDGNDPGDQLNLAQNLDSLRGKILRIDPDPAEIAGMAYSIPPDNPFVGKPGRDEIFAYGFRNPHSFDFYRPKGGETHMVISDVGQARVEELNYLPFKNAFGANFGWKMYEGQLPYDCGDELCPGGGTPAPVTPLVWPVLTYPHTKGCAIIGGPVVEDPSLTKIDGRILYGDFCYNRVRTALPDTSWIENDKFIGTYMPPGKDQHPALNGFGEDGWGRVYALSNFGEIYRLSQRAVRIGKPVKPAKPGKKPGKKKPGGKKTDKKDS